MLEFQKKKKIRKILYSPVVLLLLAIILVLILRGFVGVYKKAKISAQSLERERIELDKLSSREKNLAASIDYLKTDQGIENEIRTKFRAVKDGEQVAVIIDNNATSVPVIATSTPSLFYRLFHW